MIGVKFKISPFELTQKIDLFRDISAFLERFLITKGVKIISYDLILSEDFNTKLYKEFSKLSKDHFEEIKNIPFARLHKYSVSLLIDSNIALIHLIMTFNYQKKFDLEINIKPIRKKIKETSYIFNDIEDIFPDIDVFCEKLITQYKSKIKRLIILPEEYKKEIHYALFYYNSDESEGKIELISELITSIKRENKDVKRKLDYVNTDKFSKKIVYSYKFENEFEKLTLSSNLAVMKDSILIKAKDKVLGLSKLKEIIKKEFIDPILERLPNEDEIFYPIYEKYDLNLE